MSDVHLQDMSSDWLRLTLHLLNSTSLHLPNSNLPNRTTCPLLSRLLWQLLMLPSMQARLSRVCFSKAALPPTR
ncbi:hypothetical protein RSOLAG1IB_09428 [Rhizoctonia solani AG-1 IB]|uniref:Uncharacterized protein n=1 Tax=Thanatephorus cucumeris (strain AG1-IB / isolate 7/3/14) TaxID=1108050 RepID=A0A0B7FR95_THACB|nr:hypothetical protein RSOLAG1IB_09428 [Rhizoctonia solani AG-1 IB]